MRFKICVSFLVSIVACRAVSRQRFGEHIPAATDTHAKIEVLFETVFSARSVQRGYKEDSESIPCGGGIEYLHRNPARRRKRRVGKSGI
jgi:hypothetical protein